MKTHTLFRWFRRVAMLSGIPALTMMFACCCKYGMPDNLMSGYVYDNVYDDSSEPAIQNVSVQLKDGSTVATTDEYGYFYFTSGNCEDLCFSKEGYQSKDTTLCPDNYHHIILMEKLPEE